MLLLKIYIYFFYLWSIAKLEFILSFNDLEKVVHAFVCFRLDYCNTLCLGVSQASLSRLQLVQNSAVRLLTGTKTRDHITPVLISLHWLPIRYTIQYKVLSYVFKPLHGLAPAYTVFLIELVYINLLRFLLSNDQLCLMVPRQCRGDRVFSVAAPRLWNEPPLSLKTSLTLGSFQWALKTYLFSLVFNNVVNHMYFWLYVFVYFCYFLVQHFCTHWGFWKCSRNKVKSDLWVNAFTKKNRIIRVICLGIGWIAPVVLNLFDSLKITDSYEWFISVELYQLYSVFD